MSSLKKHSCWEIMQCSGDGTCPVRQNGQMCWEWMEKNNEFQCHYGLCEECIVYLYNNENPILSSKDVEDFMKMRNRDGMQMAV